MRRSRVHSRDCSRVLSPLQLLSTRHLTHFYLAYQTEIDSLTKRSKASENAFLHVYKILAEAPDPYPLLETAVVRPYYLGVCVTSANSQYRTKP
jgi:hypothetical protein